MRIILTVSNSGIKGWYCRYSAGFSCFQKVLQHAGDAPHSAHTITNVNKICHRKKEALTGGYENEDKNVKFVALRM